MRIAYWKRCLCSRSQPSSVLAGSPVTVNTSSEKGTASVPAASMKSISSRSGGGRLGPPRNTVGGWVGGWLRTQRACQSASMSMALCAHAPLCGGGLVGASAIGRCTRGRVCARGQHGLRPEAHEDRCTLLQRPV